LEIRFQLLSYGALYLPGGMADQPYALTRRMNAALNVYRAWRSFKQSHDYSSLQVNSPDEWRIIEGVLKLRESQHG